MNTRFLIIFAVIIAILTSVFAFQNTQIVEVVFIKWKVEMPTILLMLMSFGLGFLLAILLAVPGQIKRWWEKWGLKSKVKGLEKKVVKEEKKLEKTEKKLEELTQVETPNPEKILSEKPQERF